MTPDELDRLHKAFHTAVTAVGMNRDAGANAKHSNDALFHAADALNKQLPTLLAQLRVADEMEKRWNQMKNTMKGVKVNLYDEDGKQITFGESMAFKSVDTAAAAYAAAKENHDEYFSSPVARTSP